MGTIFGISDLPVTIFTTPLEPVEVPKPFNTGLPRRMLGNATLKHDIYVTKSMVKKSGFLKKFINGMKKV